MTSNRKILNEIFDLNNPIEVTKNKDTKKLLQEGCKC